MKFEYKNHSDMNDDAIRGDACCAAMGRCLDQEYVEFLGTGDKSEPCVCIGVYHSYYSDARIEWLAISFCPWCGQSIQCEQATEEKP